MRNRVVKTEDLIQQGWLSVTARGHAGNVQRAMKAYHRDWMRGGVVNKKPRPLTGDGAPTQPPTTAEPQARRVEADLKRYRRIDRLMREIPHDGHPMSHGEDGRARRQRLPSLGADGWHVIGTPRETAGDHVPTGEPPGRPPKVAPPGAQDKLLTAAGIEPTAKGMGELRSLVKSGRKGRDPRLVKAVVECRDFGAPELARLLGCSRQAINAILRQHRDV
jgi:hypothetical protein